MGDFVETAKAIERGEHVTPKKGCAPSRWEPLPRGGHVISTGFW